MKDEREVLTRQVIREKLMWEAKRSIVNALMPLLLGALLFGMMCLLLFSFSQISTVTKLIIILFVSLYFIAVVFLLIRGILSLIKARQKDFTVAEDVLIDVKDNRFSFWQLLLHGGVATLFGNKAHLRHIFHFKSGKTFIVNVEEYKNTRLHTAAEFSSSGDPFFLVFYSDSPDKILRLYSCKTYNFIDK